MKQCLVKWFLSFRTSLALFVALGVAVVIGTWIPQGLSYTEYIQRFGLKTANMITTCHFDHIYASFYMQFFAVLLALQLLGCLLLRLRGKANLKKWGSLIFHFSLILVIVSGFWSYASSEEERLDLAIGETQEATVGRLAGTQVTLNDLKIDFYPDGSPKQYYAQATLKKGDKRSEKGNLSVNHPLKWEQMKLYQDRYSWLVRGSVKEGTEKQPFALKIGEKFNLEQGKILRTLFIPNFDGETLESRTAKPENPVLFAVVEGQNGGEQEAFIPLHQEQTIAGIQIAFEGYEPFSGLYLKSNPAIGLVKLSFILAILGLLLRYLPSLKTRKGGV